MAANIEQNRQFKTGGCLRFPLYTPKLDGSVGISYEKGTIEAVKEGGFFGRVLILEDKPYVLKTSIPNHWRDLWRRFNWDFRDFPSQVNETQAQMDCITTNLIADALPVLTDGRFIAPRSFGYTRFPNQYVQAVERMYSRPPRYDTTNDEFGEFSQAREELTSLGLDLGLEQIGQIYKRGRSNNPFGMANLRKNTRTAQNGKDVKVWLDTLPAIPHKGWIWPFYYFGFHKDIRDWFYPPESGHQETTFNRVHTDRFLEKITSERHKFTNDLYQRICSNLNLYDQLYQQLRGENPGNRNFRSAIWAGLEFMREQLPKPFSFIKDAITTSVRLIRNPNTAALAGVENAFKADVINKDELDAAKATLSPDVSATRTMAVFYETYGWLLSKPAELLSYAGTLGLDIARVEQTNILELLTYATNQFENPHKALSVAAIFFGFKAFNGLVRYTGTRVIGKYYGIDTTRTRLLTLMPYIGDYTALAAQATDSIGRNGGEIWHYTVRNIVAKTSSLPIFPDGGWGSEREGRWWKRWGHYLDALGCKNNNH